MNALEAIKAKHSIKILPYSSTSASAKEVLAYIREKYDKSAALRARDPVMKNAFIIRWGGSQLDYAAGLPVLNRPGATRTTVNKINSFTALSDKGVRVPAFTTSTDTASSWLTDGAVVARHALSAHSGAGIQIVTQEGVVYRAPDIAENKAWYSAKLFTKYVKKASEYRVFVVGQSPVFAYRKGADKDIPTDQRQYYVRTHATGWNFCAIELSDVPEDVLEQAVKASLACTCHFSAVDVGWNEHKQEATVYEVNSAPGVTGGSVPKFVDALLLVDHDMRFTVAPAQQVELPPEALAVTWARRVQIDPAFGADQLRQVNPFTR